MQSADVRVPSGRRARKGPTRHRRHPLGAAGSRDACRVRPGWGDDTTPVGVLWVVPPSPEGRVTCARLCDASEFGARHRFPPVLPQTPRGARNLRITSATSAILVVEHALIGKVCQECGNAAALMPPFRRTGAARPAWPSLQRVTGGSGTAMFRMRQVRLSRVSRCHWALLAAKW